MLEHFPGKWILDYGGTARQMQNLAAMVQRRTPDLASDALERNPIILFRSGSSVPIPKFANLCGTSDANFGIKGTLANISS
jgi:hypothetical protein